MAKCAAMLKDIKNSTEIEMHVKLEKKKCWAPSGFAEV